MSAMPAWGGSHDDATMWSMVAFLQKLPGMSPAQYKDMVARAPADHDMDMDDGGHSHSHGASDEDAHAAPDMTGMDMDDGERKSTRLNSRHYCATPMPSSA